MQAVILAAGIGQRLGELTRDRPKALVRVCGKELILWVMDFLDHPGVGERIVVTGYEAPKLEEFLNLHRPGVRTVHNPDFRDGSIRTIEAALPHLKEDFLLMNVDHIYERRLLDLILKHRRGIAAVCDFDRELAGDDMKVKLGADGNLSLISKALLDFDGGYIGMTFVPDEEFTAYRRAVRGVLRKEGDAAAVERAISLAAAAGSAVRICDASGIPWFEVDTPEDLARAEAGLGDNRSFMP